MPSLEKKVKLLQELEKKLTKINEETAEELRKVTAALATMHNHLHHEHSESHPASFEEELIHGALHDEQELLEVSDVLEKIGLAEVHEVLDKVNNVVADINRVNRAKVAGEVPTTVRDSYKQAGAPLPGRLFGNSSASSLASSQTLTSSSDSELEFSSRSPSLSSSG